MSTSVSFDRVSDIYDATRGLPPEVSAQVTEYILNLVSATPETKFLEVGIGTGRIALPIVQRGFDYTGADISDNMLNELRRKLEGANHRLTLLNADATNLPFEDDSFDVVLTVHVLHLIPNWKQALAEIRRVLKPNGLYLYSHGRINLQPDDTDLSNLRSQLDQQWQTILTNYGYELKPYGANAEEVLAELAEQGATVEFAVAAQWQSNLTLQDWLNRYEKKQYSASWQVPDEIFSRSIPDLRQWAEQEYGSLDTPLSRDARFKLAVVRWA